MFAVAIGAIGLIVGPWISAIVDSVPDYSGGGRRINTCARCGRGHGWYRFVPLLGTRACTECGESQRLTSLGIQLLTATAFALAAARIGREPELIPILGFIGALIALSAVDVERYRLPDRLLFPSVGVLAVAVTVVSVAASNNDHLVPAIVGALVYFVALLVPNLVSPGGLAFGDVKLALLLGMFLGWVRPSVIESIVLVIYALVLGMILGIASGLLVGTARRIWGPGVLPDPDVPEDERDVIVPILKTQFPFGPALALAAVTVMFSSATLIGTPGLF